MSDKTFDQYLKVSNISEMICLTDLAIQHVMYSTLNKQQQDEICWANTTDCFICIKLAHLY